jgi:hypothetical protein
MMAEAQALMQAVQHAATAAAEAATALRDVGVSKHSGFSEANRAAQCPKEFGSAVSAEDSTNWSAFPLSFKQFLCFADDGYSADLKHVEDHGDVEVTFQNSVEGQASKARSTKLYAILS